MPKTTLTVPADTTDLRADKLLASHYPAVSRTRLQKLFDQGEVTLGGKPILKSMMLKAGDKIAFPHPDSLQRPLQAKRIAFDILYEDKHMMAIDKPVGVAVHPVSVDDTQLTIAHGVLAYLGEKARTIGEHSSPDIEDDLEIDPTKGTPVYDRPGIVHRLDKETSGVLLIAKTQQAYDALKAIFAERQIQKIYLAIVRDCPDLLAGSIVAPIGRSPRNPMRMSINDETGKPSRTDWDRVAIDPVANVGLLRCELHTGRTHQARVHLAHIGHPVLGDTTYGYRGPYSGRILLHAHQVALPHPITGQTIIIDAPIPADFLAFQQLFPGVKRAIATKPKAKKTAPKKKMPKKKKTNNLRKNPTKK